jgi:hypothetical protein
VNPRNYWFDAVLIAGTAFLGLVVTASIAVTPRDPLAPVAVVFAPWIGADAAMAAATGAGAQVLQAGGSSNIIIVQPGDAGYAARVTAEGAWLVADAAAVGGCVVAR